MQGQTSPTLTHAYMTFSAHFDASSIPAGDSYFIVLPKRPDNALNLPTGVPLIYRDDSLTFDQLGQRYLQQYGQYHPEPHDRVRITFSEDQQHQLESISNIRELKKKLCKSNIDGTVIYVEVKGQHQKDDDHEESDSEYDDESGLLDFIDMQGSKNVESYEAELHFRFSDELLVTVPLEAHQTQYPLQDACEECIKRANQLLTKPITAVDIVEYKLQYTASGQKEIQDCDLKPELSFKNHPNMYTGSLIQVKLKKDYQLKPDNINESRKLGLKIPVLNDPKNSPTIDHKTPVEYKQFLYDKIKTMSVSRFLKENCKLENNLSWGYCLRFDDMLIKPNEPISKAEKLFPNKEGMLIKAVGQVVTEKMYFYKKVGELVKDTEINKKWVDDLIPQERRIALRNDIEKGMQERHNQRRKSQLDTPLENIDQIQPIRIYTEQIVVEGNPDPIYKRLNQHLRLGSLLSSPESSYQKAWEYKLASSLLNSLKKLDNHSQQVYRGAPFDMVNPPNEEPKKPGDRIMFKAFSSTSLSPTVAYMFAQQNPTASARVLVVMNIRSGKNIREYSKFADEDELLLQPYSEFYLRKSVVVPTAQLWPIVQSTNKQRIDPNHQGVKDLDKWLNSDYTPPQNMELPFRVYLLQQVEQSLRQLPKTKTNYIIWVDDKTMEGQAIYYDIKTMPCSMVFIQLRSTRQVEQWLHKNLDFILDESSNLVFLSNMVREGNWYAGCDTIQLVRQFCPLAPIMIYVGNQEKARSNLRDKQIETDELLEVTNNAFTCIQFIQKHTSVTFGSKKTQSQLWPAQKQPAVNLTKSQPVNVNKTAPVISSSSSSKSKQQEQSRQSGGKKKKGNECVIM